MLKILLPLMFLLCSFQTFASKSYIPFVKSIDQYVIKNPHPINNKKRFEGCGPIAAASLLGYWKTERNYSTMERGDAYAGHNHPYHTIRRFYRVANSRAAPVKSKWTDGKKYPQSFTTAVGLTRGLRHYAKKANKNRRGAKKLKVKRMMMTRSWKKRLSTLKKQFKRKNPVILLIKNIPACLNSKNNKSGGWHYVVAVGHNDARKSLYILSGWRERDLSVSSGPSVHRRIANPNSNVSHVTCSYKEMKKAKPGLFWIER